MSDKTGGSAFPMPIAISPAGDEHIAYMGMTLRDYFAAKFLEGWIGNSDLDQPAKEVARIAYHMADLMIEERSK